MAGIVPPGGGKPALTQADAGALMQRLNANAPPQNPNTADFRLDPEVEYVESLGRARVTVETVIKKIPETETDLRRFFGVFHAAIMALLGQQDPQGVIQHASQMLSLSKPPMAGAQPSPPMGGAPAPGGMPPGMPPGGQPGAAPPMGGAVPSPPAMVGA